jgi:tetratricopeptide (TPR) repeat protein
VTRPLFEQYKDALRRGHLAARALKIDDALAAYADAARLAPDRAAPHTSTATVLHRSGRDVDALAAFERALAIARDDEPTLRARAAVFRDMGRLASAAADLERLAEALDADGRRADALVAARESVTLTANAARRALVARLEAPEDDSAPRARPTAVERAAAAKPPAARSAPAPQPATPAGAHVTPAPKLGAEPLAAASEDDPFAARLAAVHETLEAETASDDRPAVEPPPPAEPASPAPAASSSTLLDLYDAPIDAGASAPAKPSRNGVAPPDLADAANLADPRELMEAQDLGLSPEAAAPAAPKAPIGFMGPDVAPAEDEWSAPVRRSSFDLAPGVHGDALVQLEEDESGAAIPWPAIDLPSAPPPPIVGPPPDPETLMAEAHALIDGGNPKDARNLMLTAVMVHRAAGRPDAALDVCLQLLALAPGDAHVHLAIAGLQLDRGWRTLATDKIGLLLRLTALTGDTQAEADAHALAAERLRDETPASFARA